MTNSLGFPSSQCCQFGLPPHWLRTDSGTPDSGPALSITSSKWIYFLYQRHCIRESWGEPWLGITFLVAADSSLSFQERWKRKETEGGQPHLTFIIPLQFHTNSCTIQHNTCSQGRSSVEPTFSTSTCTPFSEPRSSQVIRREASLILGANPPDPIYSLPDSFFPPTWQSHLLTFFLQEPR